jgi:hypothetical protein
MQAIIIDDGTLDTVVQITALGTTWTERFESDYRYDFDPDPDISTEFFLESVLDDLQDDMRENARLTQQMEEWDEFDG